MKRFNRNYIPLKFKLLWYFLFFGAIILVVLWAFQSFFLESFYTMSKSAQVERKARIISRSIQENKNIKTTIQDVASSNGLSVYIYLSSGSLLDGIYSCEYDNPATALNLEYHDVYSYYYEAQANGGTYMCVTSNSEEDVARQKITKLINQISSPDSAQNDIRFKVDKEKNRTKNMVYADIIKSPDESEYFLIITSSITPLTNTVDIIKSQLIIVSMVFVLLSILFSIYASRRIAKPISRTNTAAKELAKKNYDVDFNAVGYLEVEELNETLNYAKSELAATEKLQRELIANISHDLRTPLTMITGYGEVMRDLPGENTPENIQINRQRKGYFYALFKAQGAGRLQHHL